MNTKEEIVRDSANPLYGNGARRFWFVHSFDQFQ